MAGKTKRKRDTVHATDAPPQNPASTGRPPATFNPEVVESLSRIGAPIAEIAMALEVDYNVVNDWMKSNTAFIQAYQKGKSSLHLSLRRKSVQLALQGNVQMLLALRKVVLGEADAFDIYNHDMTPEKFASERNQIVEKIRKLAVVK